MRHVTAILLLFILCPLSGAQAAVSPLSQLSDPEKTYYTKIFDYTMQTVPVDGTYQWASYDGKGSITLSNPFTSKSGAICRNFTESFVVKGQSGADKGVGCKRNGADGWCKLDASNAMTCAMEDPAFMFGDVNVPNVTMPNIAPINGPGGNSGSGISGPNANVNVDTSGAPKNVTSKSYSDSVTGNAGKAAGSAASNGLSWFTSTFR